MQVLENKKTSLCFLIFFITFLGFYSFAVSHSSHEPSQEQHESHHDVSHEHHACLDCFAMHNPSVLPIVFVLQPLSQISYVIPLYYYDCELNDVAQSIFRPPIFV